MYTVIFLAPLYLPPGNTVISVGVVKTAIKSLSVRFPMTVFRLGEGRLRGCVVGNGATDNNNLEDFCGVECDLH